MRLYEIADLTFHNETLGYHHGQSDHSLIAYKDGEYVGQIDYAVYQDEPHVQMIRVRPGKQYRRKGYGTALVLHLQSLFPDTEIAMGMTTAAGSKLLRAIPKTVIKDADVIAKRRRLRTMRATLDRWQKRADVIYAKDQMSDKDRKFLGSARWNELSDQVDALDDALRGAKPSKVLFRR